MQPTLNNLQTYGKKPVFIIQDGDQSALPWSPIARIRLQRAINRQIESQNLDLLEIQTKNGTIHITTVSGEKLSWRELFRGFFQLNRLRRDRGESVQNKLTPPLLQALQRLGIIPEATTESFEAEASRQAAILRRTVPLNGGARGIRLTERQVLDTAIFASINGASSFSNGCRTLLKADSVLFDAEKERVGILIERAQQLYETNGLNSDNHLIRQIRRFGLSGEGEDSDGIALNEQFSKWLEENKQLKTDLDQLLQDLNQAHPLTSPHSGTINNLRQLSSQIGGLLQGMPVWYQELDENTFAEANTPEARQARRMTEFQARPGILLSNIADVDSSGVTWKKTVVDAEIISGLQTVASFLQELGEANFQQLSKDDPLLRSDVPGRVRSSEDFNKLEPRFIATQKKALELRQTAAQLVADLQKFDNGETDDRAGLELEKRLKEFGEAYELFINRELKKTANHTHDFYPVWTEVEGGLGTAGGGIGIYDADTAALRAHAQFRQTVWHYAEQQIAIGTGQLAGLRQMFRIKTSQRP